MSTKENGETLAREQFSIDPSMKIGCVSLNVSDLSRSLDFYKSILGFKITSRISSDRALLSVSRNDSSRLVELVQVEDSPSNDKSSPFQAAKRAGLFHFAILLPERKFLADMFQNLLDKGDQVHFDGLADHLVSESIYIRDPDFNGIEIYGDRPASEWNWNGSHIEMATLHLNTNDLLRESMTKGWQGMPPKTTIGHVHLHVRNLSKATKFYHETLGLNVTSTLPGANFFAVGKYHHHIAANTWLGTGIGPALPDNLGLNHFSVELQGKEEFANLLQQLSLHGIIVNRLTERSAIVHDMDGIKIQIQHK